MFRPTEHNFKVGDLVIQRGKKEICVVFDIGANCVCLSEAFSPGEYASQGGKWVSARRANRDPEIAKVGMR